MTFASSAFAETSPGTTLVPGEFLLTTEDFKTISQAIYADAGIFMPESKATLVYSRLARRLRALGIESFTSSCDLIKSQAGVEERQRMLAALTTNVTRFFREGHHFEHLRKSFLPGALARAKRGESIRIWSAGCSNGQEAYTMALVILDMLPNAADLDIRILASDIDPNVLEEGRAVFRNRDVIHFTPDILNVFIGAAQRPLAYEHVDIADQYPQKIGCKLRLAGPDRDCHNRGIARVHDIHVFLEERINIIG